MYKDKKIILIAPAYNEDRKIGEVVRRAPRDIIDKVLVVDDGSSDDTASVAENLGATVVSLGAVRGVGYAIREGYRVAVNEGFDIAVVIAGNNKDAPEEITRLLDPICDDDFEFVMGSRYLEGGGYGGDMPFYRKLATRLHPFLVSIFTGQRITESTNGYRALNTSILADKRLNLDQDWLNHYQLEVYLLMRVLKLGFRCTEVPVTKIYPPKKIGNTKMRPIVDWWKILSPIFYIGLGLRR
jgi:dolichol-phosphate mannosyltransferase